MGTSLEPPWVAHPNLWFLIPLEVFEAIRWSLMSWMTVAATFLIEYVIKDMDNHVCFCSAFAFVS